MTTQYAPLSDAELAAIEKRCEAAMPPPWDIVPASGYRGSHSERIGPIQGAHVGDLIDQGVDDPDALFIAASRMDVPRLVAEVRRLRQALESIAQCGVSPAPILTYQPGSDRSIERTFIDHHGYEIDIAKKALSGAREGE